MREKSALQLFGRDVKKRGSFGRGNLNERRDVSGSVTHARHAEPGTGIFSGRKRRRGQQSGSVFVRCHHCGRLVNRAPGSRWSLVSRAGQVTHITLSSPPLLSLSARATSVRAISLTLGRGVVLRKEAPHFPSPL